MQDAKFSLDSVCHCVFIKISIMVTSFSSFAGPAPLSLVMENSSVASASSEAGSTRSQEIEELERFIDSYVLEYQVQGLLGDKSEVDADGGKPQSHISQVSL